MGTGTSFETTGQAANVSLERRREIAALPPGRSAHTEQFRGLSLFREIEIAKPPRGAAPLSPPARVAFWNAERCKHVEASAALLAGVGADVNLLCEMDSGMARSGQRHTVREVAGRLGQGYAFAVEFLELGHGNERERAAHAHEENASGVHGAAIASPHGLGRPALIRLDADGAWFDGANGERRVGGRIALAATIPVGGVEVAFASVHFESHGGPAGRAGQMGVLLAALDAYAGAAPVVIGGDFNTHSMSHRQLKDVAARDALVDADPGRLLDPVSHEPMFALAAAAGYDWRACNVLGVSTTRNHPGEPPGPPCKLDWFFTRGLAAEGAVVVAALDGATAISDHELIAVTVSLQ